MDLFDRIEKNLPYEDDKENFYKNIIIKFMNKSSDTFDLNIEDIESAEERDYYFCKELYYEIPLLLYAIREYMNGLQSGGTQDSNPEYQKYVTSTSCTKSYIEGN